MYVRDLACAGHLPTVGMVVSVADRAYFHTPGIFFVNWFKTEGTAVLNGARKPDTCASVLSGTDMRFTGAYLD